MGNRSSLSLPSYEHCIKEPYFPVNSLSQFFSTQIVWADRRYNINKETSLSTEGSSTSSMSPISSISEKGPNKNLAISSATTVRRSTCISILSHLIGRTGKVLLERILSLLEEDHISLKGSEKGEEIKGVKKKQDLNMDPLNITNNDSNKINTIMSSTSGQLPNKSTSTTTFSSSSNHFPFMSEKTFIRLMYLIGPFSTREEKEKLLFLIYNVKMDGYWTKKDLGRYIYDCQKMKLEKRQLEMNEMQRQREGKKKGQKKAFASTISNSHDDHLTKDTTNIEKENNNTTLSTTTTTTMIKDDDDNDSENHLSHEEDITGESTTQNNHSNNNNNNNNNNDNNNHNSNSNSTLTTARDHFPLPTPKPNTKRDLTITTTTPSLAHTNNNNRRDKIIEANFHKLTLSTSCDIILSLYDRDQDEKLSYVEYQKMIKEGELGDIYGHFQTFFFPFFFPSISRDLSNSPSISHKKGNRDSTKTRRPMSPVPIKLLPNDGNQNKSSPTKYNNDHNDDNENNVNKDNHNDNDKDNHNDNDKDNRNNKNNSPFQQAALSLVKLRDKFLKNYVNRFLVSEMPSKYEKYSNEHGGRQFKESKDGSNTSSSTSSDEPQENSLTSPKKKRQSKTSPNLDNELGGPNNCLDYSYLMFEYPGGTFDSLFQSEVNLKLKTDYDHFSLGKAYQYNSIPMKNGGGTGTVYSHYGGGI